jgi:hypothetical protein
LINRGLPASSAARLLSGFSVEQLASEYCALRASVLQLWTAESQTGLSADLDGVTQFNEAIDQALAEATTRYATLIQESQNLFLGWCCKYQVPGCRSCYRGHW